MAWTYDVELLTDKDLVRLMVGDILEIDPQLSDEEITALLGIYTGVRATAIAVCRILAAKYARYADKWVGDLKILASQKHEAYLRLAEELATAPVGAENAGAGIFAGAIRISQKETVEGDSNRTVPSFKRGLMDNEEWD